MAFVVPSDGITFTSQILTRCEDLITFKVWGGLDHAQLRAWMNNFSNEIEQYFAACILDHLIYRSNDQTRALIQHMLLRCLTDTTRRQPPTGGPIDSWLARLRSESMSQPPIVVVPVLPVGSVTKSGHVIARELKRRFEINDDWIVSPDEIASWPPETIIIFVDDFLGTGHQFEGFVNARNLAAAIKTHYCIYAPLAAHEDGVVELNRLYPSLLISAVEILSRAHGVFDGRSSHFIDRYNSVEDARHFYVEMLNAKGITPPTQFGHGEFALLYAFEHATPDNSLPILWHKATNFEPLVPR